LFPKGFLVIFVPNITTHGYGTDGKGYWVKDTFIEEQD
jgi:hypothetical protein